jgi:putative aldouronate transport system substrate-binding protein
MKKRLFAMLLSLSLVVVLLSGCGGNGQSTQAVSSDSQSAASEDTVEQVPDTQSAPEEVEEKDETSQMEDSQETETFQESQPLSYPISDGSVSFTILHAEPQLGPMSGQMDMSTYGDFETIAAATEYIGVTPEWISLSQMNGETQFNLVVASGDYPDVFTAIDKYYTGSFQKAYEDEVIIQLDEYLAEDMPEYWNLIHEDKELLRAVTSDDGSYMAWYSIYDKTVVNEGYFVRKDWCDLLNMDVPTNVDELNDFLYGIKSELNLDSSLLLGDGLSTMAEAWGVGGTAASGSGFAYHREGDTLVADIASEAYKDYVAQLHQWYVDRIVSQNFTELDTGNMSGDMERELAADRTAVVSTMVNSMDNLTNDDPNFELAAMVVTLDGGNLHTGGGERQFDSTCISTQCDPELIPYIMGWMNYWYTEEGAMAMSYGVEGLDYGYDADGNIMYLKNITENEYGYPAMLYSRARCFSGASFGLMYQDRTVPFYTEAQEVAIETWTSRTDNEEAIPNGLGLNSEESEIVALYATDLATYMSEEIPKFVTGDRDMSEWDAFVENCMGMHVDELLAAYQGAFDRYYVK